MPVLYKTPVWLLDDQESLNQDESCPTIVSFINTKKHDFKHMTCIICYATCRLRIITGFNIVIINVIPSSSNQYTCILVMCMHVIFSYFIIL